jgi:hypothetical protein
MDTKERDAKFVDEMKLHPEASLAEHDTQSDAFDANGGHIVLTDETGKAVPRTVYMVNGGGADGRLIQTIDAYAAGNGGDNGNIGAMKFFSTRKALNDFLANNTGWQEKYGNSDTRNPPNTTYLFAGAVNPGWDPSYKPPFTIKGRLEAVTITPSQFTDAVYWHEWAHFPPVSAPGTTAGENEAWEYGLRRAGVEF